MTFSEIVHLLSAADQQVIKDMMSLYEGIDRQTKEFSRLSGLKCKNGCGACCTNPEIETTVAEVLPLAVYWWSTAQREDSLKTPSSVESTLQSIRAKSSQGVCFFYKPDSNIHTQGSCGIYAYRPGLCRLFGFAARKDKYGKPVLVTCKVIKESFPQEYKLTQEKLQEERLTGPLLSAHAFSVTNIDPVHGQKPLPINKAIAKALEKIGFCIDAKLNKY